MVYVDWLSGVGGYKEGGRLSSCGFGARAMLTFIYL